MRALSRVADGLLHAGSFGLVGLLLITVGGPLATDDLWWHLELGDLYHQLGPWLTEDPRLHTALGPPAPNAWLFDLLLARLADATSLYSLRVLHAVSVAAIVALVWRVLLRASRSAPLASLFTAVFVVCSTYRLVQLRPELATIAASLVIYLLVLEPRILSWPRMAGAVCACALWANLHPGYLLGPVLMFTTAAALAVSSRLRSGDASEPDRARAARLALTGGAALLASGLNPDGFAALANYGRAGAEAARAGLIVDEWSGLDLLSMPSAHLPPTPLAWACLWLILPAALWIAGRECGGWLRGDGNSLTSRTAAIDPGLIALAVAGVLAPFVAVRFLWLCYFPLLLIAAAWRSRVDAATPAMKTPNRGYSALGWIGCASMLLLLVGYSQTPVASRAASLLAAPFSAWPSAHTRLHTRVHAQVEAYASAYDADRYYAHAVWFLRDSGVEGRLFNPYFAGGFFEYWLSPKLRTFVDGSLNFPDEVLRDHTRILTQGGNLTEFDLGGLLDRYAVDFFVGVGLPTTDRPGRPWRYSSHHLERDRDWILVYRGLRSAVYMRRSPRNQANLERIAAFYKHQGVHFSRDEGLDVVATLEGSTAWSIEHGLAPVDYPELVQASNRAEPRMRATARERLASTYAALGLYARAVEVDSNPQAGPSGRRNLANGRRRDARLAWSLMRLDRLPEALQHVRLDERKVGAPYAAVRHGVEAYAAAESDEARARIAAMTTVFSRREAGELKSVELPAFARPQRSREDSGKK